MTSDNTNVVNTNAGVNETVDVAPVVGAVEDAHKAADFAEIQDAFKNELIDAETVYEHVCEGDITPEDFSNITGEDYDEASARFEASNEAEAAKLTYDKEIAKADEIAKEQAQAKAEETNIEVLETLSQYKPTQAQDSNEAREHVQEALNEFLEHKTKGETSLRSTMAITVADYLYFNTDYSAIQQHTDDKNREFHVRKDMYKDVLKNLSGLIDPEDWNDSTVQATCGSATRTAMLLMAGRLKVGWFCLPQERKAVRGNDVAFPEYPNPEQAAGKKILRAVCIPSNVLAPKVYALLPGGQRSEVENTDTSLVLCSQAVTDTIYNSLWDKDGQIEHDPISGRISSFLTGAQVVEKAKREEARAVAAAKKEEEAKQPSTPSEPEGRETGGVVSEESEVSIQTFRSLINSIPGDIGAKLREGWAAIDHRLLQTQRELSQLQIAASGDVLNGLLGLRSIIRERGNHIPAKNRCELAVASHELFRRVYLTDAKPMSKDEAMAWIMVKRDLDVLLVDREDGSGVIVNNPETEKPAVTYDIAPNPADMVRAN